MGKNKEVESSDMGVIVLRSSELKAVENSTELTTISRVHDKKTKIVHNVIRKFWIGCISGSQKVSMRKRLVIRVGSCFHL